MTFTDLSRGAQAQPARGRWARILTVLGLLLVFGFVAHRVFVPDTFLEVQLSARMTPDRGLRLYYGMGKTDFSEQQAVNLEPGIATEGGLFTFRATLAPAQPITVIRLDPEYPGGQVEIGAMSFRTGRGESTLAGKALSDSFTAVEGLEAAAGLPGTTVPGNDRVVLQMTGQDPYLVMEIPQAVQDRLRSVRKKSWTWLRSAWTPLVGVFLLVLVQRRRFKQVVGAAQNTLGRWADTLSRGTTVPIGRSAVLILLALPIGFVAYVGMGLHNSSISTWTDQYGYPLHYPTFERGETQEIRSDEWFVHTPWLLNQVQTGMKVYNPNIGPPGSTLVAGVPVIHPTALAQPQFWGYMLFGTERGFSWNWGFRAVSLIGSVFVLLLLLTRGQTAISLAGSLAVFGSSFVQWWYASWLTEIITGLATALIGVFLWANARNPKLIHGAVVLAALAGMHAVLQPYLPALLSLAYLGVFTGAALVWESHRSGALQEQGRHRAWALALGVVVFVGLFWSYYDTAKNAIEVILNTVYPGRRKLPGGGLPWNDFGVGFFDFWRDKYATPLPSNSSEAARPLLVFPFVALAAIAMARRVRLGATFWAILAYCAFAVVWMSVPLPDPLGQWFGSIGLEKIPNTRMYGGLGVASWMLAVVVFARFKEQEGLKRRHTLLLVLVTIATVYWAWSFQKQQQSPGYYTVERLLVAMLVLSSVVWAVCRSNRIVFFAGVVLAIYMPVQINPTSSGLNRLLDKELLHRTTAMDPSGQEQWIVFGGTPLSQVLRANGHRVLSGEYFVPRFDLMHRFDPEETNIYWWNRYGTVNFAASTDPSVVEFSRDKPSRPDAITLHPCHPTLKALGVTRFVFHEKPDLSQLPCLKPLGEFAPINVYVYGAASSAP